MGWELTEEFESAHGRVRWKSWGAGPPVVFMHGTPWSSYTWREIAPAVGGGRTVYVWDMPGYGRSEKRSGQDVSLAAQQAVFTALLGHWGLERPAVVAHDYGGAVALRTALLDGVRYERLALIDTVTVRPWGSPFFRLVNENAPIFEALPGYIHEAVVRRYIATAAHRELRREVLDELVAPWLGEAGQPAFYRQIAQANERYTAEIEDRFGEVGCPVLIGWGEQDTWLPPDRAEKLAGLIPGARLEWIEGAGHLVHEDAPARLTAMLAEFLR